MITEKEMTDKNAYKEGQQVLVSKCETAMDGNIPEQRSKIAHVRLDEIDGLEYGIPVKFKGENCTTIVYFSHKKIKPIMEKEKVGK